MPGPRVLATRTVADIRPRDLSSEGNIGSILGGIFAGLALLVAVILGVWQTLRWIDEDKRRQAAEHKQHNKWYRVVWRKVRFWR